MALSIEYILVLFLLAFILISVRYLSKTKLFRKINDEKNIKVKEKEYLDNSTKVYVLEYEGSTLFVASNSNSISISSEKLSRGNNDGY